MCAGGEYRGVGMTGISTPLRLRIRFQRALRRNLCRAEDPEQATSRAYTILPIGGLRGTAQAVLSTKDGRFALSSEPRGTHGENQNFEHGSGVDISGSSTLSMVARRLSRLRLCRPT